MNLPGSNVLVLCPLAVMQIVEEYLNRNAKNPCHIRVVDMCPTSTSSPSYKFSVTTDKEPTRA